MSLSETTVRGCVIVVEQLPNGYWRGKLSIRIPQLTQPHEQENDAFHSAIEALNWAVGIIDSLTRSV